MKKVCSGWGHVTIGTVSSRALPPVAFYPYAYFEHKNCIRATPSFPATTALAISPYIEDSELEQCFVMGASIGYDPVSLNLTAPVHTVTYSY